MTMVPVKSSNVAAIGYDAGSRTMRVEFHSGGSYDFAGVSPEKHAAFVSAPSKGSHFHKHFRGQHESKKTEK